MTALLLIAVVVLVLRQRVLRRGRVRARARQARRGSRSRQARAGAAPRRAVAPASTTSASTCPPASSASRSPRWASASSASRRSPRCSSRCSARALARRRRSRSPSRSPTSSSRRCTSSSASRCRRSTRSSTPRASPGASRAAARAASTRGMRPFIRAAQRRVERDPAAAADRPRRRARGGRRRPRSCELLIAQARAGGQLDPGEAGMLAGVFHLHEQEARQVMTPIPAVVTVDVSEDVETALRRCVSSGHTRLVVTEDDNPDRVRGHRARQLAGPHATWPTGPRRRSSRLVQARRRSCPRPSRSTTCSPTCSASAPRWPSSSTSTAASAGIVTVEDIIEEVVGEIDDETDPAGGESAGWPTATGSCAGTSRSPTCSTTASSCRSTPTPTTRSAASSSPSSGRLPKRGDTVNANGYSIRVESVRENRIEAVRIRERRAPAGAQATG